MRISRLVFIILLSFAITAPVSVSAVNQQSIPKKEAVEQKKMDTLSLIAYVSTIVGIASLFLVPAASLFLMPVGFIMGMIAFFGGKKRYEKRRGKGLALAALAIGGAFTLVIMGSLLAFALFGF